MVFLVWNFTQSSWKKSVVIHPDQATHILFFFFIHTWGVRFDNQTMARLIAEMLLILFSVYSAM